MAKHASEAKNTLIIDNAARLLGDAKLLADHKRFASAFALAVLGVEEIGKAVLDLWERDGSLSKPVIWRTAHIRKQAAVGAVLLASFAVEKFGALAANLASLASGDGGSAGNGSGGGVYPLRVNPPDAPITDELLEQVAMAFASSPEGRFLTHVEMGALEKTKHMGIYWDDWLTAASLHADQFDEADVTSMFETARRAVGVLDDPLIMRTGRAIYETSP
jgi:hypothetical protein